MQGQYFVRSVQEPLERLQKWGIDTSFMENCLKPIICPGGGNTPEERPEEKPEQKPDVSGDGSSDKEESEALSFAEQVVNAWMNSEGHRANILNQGYTSIGVGYYLNGATPYWAQLFTY